MRDGGSDDRDRSQLSSDASTKIKDAEPAVAGHFKSEHPSAQRAPDRPALSHDLLAALAGPAEAGNHAPANAPHPAMQVIGRAVKIDGHVLVVRKGVAVTLNNGDVLLKGDVLQTGGDGVAGLVFKDGSVPDRARFAFRAGRVQL